MNCNIFKKEEEKFDINILNEQTERITGSNIFHVQAQFSGFTSKLLALITFNLQPHAMYWDKEEKQVIDWLWSPRFTNFGYGVIRKSSVEDAMDGVLPNTIYVGDEFPHERDVFYRRVEKLRGRFICGEAINALSKNSYDLYKEGWFFERVIIRVYKLSLITILCAISFFSGILYFHNKTNQIYDSFDTPQQVEEYYAK